MDHVEPSAASGEFGSIGGRYPAGGRDVSRVLAAGERRLGQFGGRRHGDSRRAWSALVFHWLVRDDRSKHRVVLEISSDGLPRDLRDGYPHDSPVDWWGELMDRVKAHRRAKLPMEMQSRPADVGQSIADRFGRASAPDQGGNLAKAGDWDREQARWTNTAMCGVQYRRVPFFANSSTDPGFMYP